MAVTRRETEVLAHQVRSRLNRPSEDDLMVFPEDYYEALSRAHRKIRNKIIQHAPEILRVEATVTSSDSGASYDLGDNGIGKLEVYAPPGPPSGQRILPALPDSSHFGFYIEGTVLYLTSPTYYSEGLTILWTPTSVSDLSDDQKHTLPAYCEEWLIEEASTILAERPGFLGNPDIYREAARREWRGDPQDPSDTGILGIIKKQISGAGFVTAAGTDDYRPWYKGIA